MMDRLTPRRAVSFIIGLYLLLALTAGAVNPLFEAPDEQLHFFTAHWIADYGRLPLVPQPDRPETAWPNLDVRWVGQEAAQPPLYYVLAAPVVGVFSSDFAAARDATVRNPFVRLGDPAAPINKNRFVHGGWDDWPWRGHVLAAHILRAVSAVIGAGTLWLIWLSARLVWSDEWPAVTAVGLVAFLPQYIFQHSAVSNDVLITFLATLGLTLLLRWWHLPDKDRARPIWLLGLGAVAGIAALTKTQGVVLLGLMGLTVGVRGLLIGRPWLKIIRDGSLVGAAGVSIAGWLWWRNWSLYGDPTAANQFVAIAGGDRAYTLAQIVPELPGLYRSLIAAFGWFNLLPPAWVYGVWHLIVGAAVVGGVWGAWRGHHVWRGWPLILGGWFGLVLASLISFMMRTPAAQGRLLFPALLPLALGAAWGLSRLPRPCWWMGGALTAGLVTAVYCIGVVIPQAYAPPVTVGATVPDGWVRVDRPLGRGLTLLAGRPEVDAVTAGEYVPVTLYWRLDEPLTAADRPELVLDLLGEQNKLVGHTQTYHGGGLQPADQWPVGVVIRSRTAVLTHDDAGPIAARINAKLAFEQSAVDVGVVKIAAAEMPPLTDDVVAVLGDAGQIELAAVETWPDVQTAIVTPGQTVAVTVTWQVREAIPQNLTTLLHLGTSGQPPVAQADGVPRHGAYPTTLWTAGERFADRYTLIIPADAAPGRYALQIGLYDAASPTFARLPVQVDGVRRPQDVFVVGDVEVGR